MPALLEHTNLTVSDPDATAAWMCALFGWHVRWSGAAMQTGRTVHVGTDARYLALYSPGRPAPAQQDTYATIGGLNHIAVVTDDIDRMERDVRAEGFTLGHTGVPICTLGGILFTSQRLSRFSHGIGRGISHDSPP